MQISSMNEINEQNSRILTDEAVLIGLFMWYLIPAFREILFGVPDSCFQKWLAAISCRSYHCLSLLIAKFPGDETNLQSFVLKI